MLGSPALDRRPLLFDRDLSLSDGCSTSHRSRARIASIRKPASKEIISDSVEL